MHPCFPLFPHRDYFDQPDSSLSCSFAPQGLFRPAGCISIFLFFTTGIISPRSNASLSCCFLPQGLFRPTECIPAFLFFPTGIISTSRIHLCPALLLRRDYFDRPDSSLASSFSPQGLFRPVRCISILLFCSSGIISTDRMHPITGRPSLKASLPGHADQFRFMCPGTEREKGRMKNFRFPHVLFRSSEDHTSLSLASYIFAAICLATYTPLAEAWDSECVMPLPSPIIYRPS